MDIIGTPEFGSIAEWFAAMADMDKEQLEEYREHLLRYCELDTFAMVKVWEKLKDI